MYIYLVTNKINGKQYVGQTAKQLWQRWRLHKSNNSGCTALKAAISKYGKDNFSIEAIYESANKIEIESKEKEFIVKYNTKSPSGYNLTDGGEGTVNLPEEIRKRAAAKLKGNKNSVGAVRSAEYLIQKSLSQLWRKFSKETRQRMSEAAKNRKDKPETRAKKSANAKRLGLRPPVLTSEEAAQAGRISGHKRYHVNRGITNPKCQLCQEAQNVLVNKPQLQTDRTTLETTPQQKGHEGKH